MSPRPSRRFGRRLTRAIQRLAPPLLWAYMRLTQRLSRRTVFNAENDPWYGGGPRAIYCGLHQGLLYDTVQAAHRGLLVMVSRSQDGVIAARFAECFGWTTVRGGSRRGGVEAYRQLKRALQQGAWGAMICDGPKGPYGVPKIGTLLLARDTGLPILPGAWWSTRQIMFKSWDRTLVPLPFGHLYFAYGEPIYVPRGATRDDCEKLQRELSDRILDLVFRCQQAAGAPRLDLRPREWIHEPQADLRATGSFGG